MATTRRKIAVIGGGVAGLTTAYLLRDAHEVVLLEADNRLGGHANTVTVDPGERTGRAGQRGGGPIDLDTGFLVYNERTYPLFTRLLARLGVTTQTTTVSFAMRDDAEGVEYGSHDWRTMLSQPRNLLRPEMHRLIYDAARFFRTVKRWENKPRATLGEFLDEERFGRAFTEFVALPLTATVWSIDYARARQFPFATWWRFLENHGLGETFNPPAWKSFAKGSRTYVRVIEAALGDRVRLSTPVSSIELRGDELWVTPSGSGPSERFDDVALAVHADHARRMLIEGKSPDLGPEIDALEGLTYNRNEIVLHTDTSVLPKQRRSWSAWNYLRGLTAPGPTVTYNLNVIQRLTREETFGVSLNETRLIPEASVLGRFTYEHPYFDHRAFDAQARIRAVSGRRRVHFAGSYLGMGFHEDAIRSANEVVKKLQVECAL